MSDARRDEDLFYIPGVSQAIWWLSDKLTASLIDREKKAAEEAIRKASGGNEGRAEEAIRQLGSELLVLRQVQVKEESERRQATIENSLANALSGGLRDTAGGLRTIVLVGVAAVGVGVVALLSQNPAVRRLVKKLGGKKR